MAVGVSRAPPPPPAFFLGGVCLFLHLPPLGWCMQWWAFGAGLPGCCWCLRFARPCPGPMRRGGYVLPAGLGSGSAGLAVAPGGSVRLCARGCGGFNLQAAVFVGGPRPLLQVARQPLAGVWRAGAAPSGGVWWLVLVRPSVSVPWFGVVVCFGAPCCVVLCFALLRRAGPCCVAVRPAGPRRVALRRAVACCALGCLVVARCTVARRGGLCRATQCCAVVGWWRSVRPVSWCGLRVRIWLPGGRGLRLGASWLGGSVLWRSGLAARAGGSVSCRRGCPPWRSVLWSRVLLGSCPLVLGAAATLSSPSGAFEVALAVARVVAWR